MIEISIEMNSKNITPIPIIKINFDSEVIVEEWKVLENDQPSTKNDPVITDKTFPLNI